MIPSHKFAGWVKAVVIAFLGFLLYRTALGYLWSRWQGEDFSYGYFILPITLYLVWEKRGILRRIPSVRSWYFLFPLTAGAILYFIGELGGEYTALFLSLWFVAISICWSYLGWNKLKTIVFPLVFLLVMFPPPSLIYNNISLWLQLISSRLGVGMLLWVGIPAYREGNIIDLGFTQLQVVEACSGLRYLFPLVAMGALLAYRYRAGILKGTILIASAIPVTVITNSLRIASVGILYPIWGAKVAQGFFHDFSGWLIFMASLAILLGELWVLNKVFPSTVRPDGADRGVESHGTTSDQVQHIPLSQAILRPPHLIVTAGVLLGMLAVSMNVDFREKIPATKPLGLMPLTIGEWRGTRYPMDSVIASVLNLTDYALMDFKDPQGKEIDVYVAYNESQQKGKSTHSPDSCLPGAGWVFSVSGTVDMKVPGGGGPSMRVKRAFMEKNGARQVAYYWFPQRGRVLTNMFQLKAYAFWDALTQRRTDGALVRLVTPVYDAENPEDAEARLQGFARQFVPILNGFLPGQERK